MSWVAKNVGDYEKCRGLQKTVVGREKCRGLQNMSWVVENVVGFK